jgi:transmembrane 9 superfamily protein 2/4
MAIVFLVNLFVWSKNSSNAIPFGTFLALVVMWLGISLPLTLVGAFFGQRKAMIEHPGRTNQIPRQIPEAVWYLRPRYLYVTLSPLRLRCFLPVAHTNRATLSEYLASL